MYSNWSYSPETPNLGQIRRFLELCDLEIWRMTLKNNRAPLLCCFQLCAWFHCHMWIQTGVRVRKRLSWVLTSVTLTFDLWPWPFAWTSLLTMVITPENFMMIRWWEHGEKGVTDRQTDRQTDGRTDRRTDGLNQSYSCLVAAKNEDVVGAVPTDDRCSNYIWVINKFIAYQGATYIRNLTVITLQNWNIIHK